MFGKVKSGQSKNTKSNRKSSARTSEKQLLAATKAADIQPDDLQQDKIITYFTNGRNINAIPADHIKVTPNQRRTVVSQLQSGEINLHDIDEFLLQVLSPLQASKSSASKVFQQITSDPYEKQILAVATGHDASNWQNVNEAELKNLLSKPIKGQPDYRTPIGFAKYRHKFIAGIKDQASSEQLATYEQAMDRFEQHLYGPRFDYYQQIQLLAGKEIDLTPVDEAKERRQVEESSIQAIITEEQEVQTSTPVIYERPQASNSLSPLTPARSNEILNQTIIDGDPWRQDSNEYPLTTASLMSSGLTPTFLAQIDQQEIILSVPFQLSDGRGAILGFIATPNGIKVRSFYLNTKTGLWHYAPDYIRGPRGEGISQIGEGYSLTSTILPFSLQTYLQDIVQSQGFQEITTVNPDFLFAGTMAAYDTQQDYRTAFERLQLRGDFYQEVDSTPILSSWQSTGKVKNAPQLLSVNANITPNFQSQVSTTKTYSILAGQVSLYNFSSYDTQYQWIFCQDDWGRTWIGNIEATSPLTTTGCHRDWVDAGNLMTPLYEYSTKSSNYGDPSDTRKGLIGMWSQYLSKIPVIQEFINWRKSQQ